MDLARRTPAHAPLILALGLAACGGDDTKTYEISSATLAGTVGGQPWTFAKGDTSAFLSRDDGFFANLYAETFDACAFGSPTGNRLILNLPKAPGDYPLSFSRNMTFVVRTGENETDNLIGLVGRLVVHSVTTGTVTGGIYAEYDDANVVDGQFSVTVCPDDD